MMMPLMDGAKAIEILKKLNSKVKFVAMSGFISNKKEVAGHIPTEVFLPKPYTAEELLTTVNHVLNVSE